MTRSPAAAQIDALIDALSGAQPSQTVFNQYAPGDPNNATRRANLQRYLLDMKARESRTLLLMEAPGYRGCRVTGLPVTSRKIMLEGVASLRIFGRENGYRDAHDPGFERVQGEQSATIVWKTLAELDALPLIWNAFPFHPHIAGQPRSNRKPLKAELEVGAAFLRRVLEIWSIERAIAVGNVAHGALAAQGWQCPKARHPAHGGRNAFVAGLRQLLSDGA